MRVFVMTQCVWWSRLSQSRYNEEFKTEVVAKDQQMGWDKIKYLKSKTELESGREGESKDMQTQAKCVSNLLLCA